MALVLVIDADEGELARIAAALEAAGHWVVTATLEPVAIAACSQNPFAVAVIGAAVPAPEKHRAFNVVREHCPSAKIVELYRPGSSPVLTEADAALPATADLATELPRRLAASAKRHQS